MSALDDFFAGVIDRDAFLRSLERWLESGDEVMRTFEAAGLAYLDCGHVRPVNSWLPRGYELPCVLCGDAQVVDLEVIAPTVYPMPDSLADLPEVA